MSKRTYIFYRDYTEWLETIQPFDLICFGPSSTTTSSSSCLSSSYLSCSAYVSEMIRGCQSIELQRCDVQWTHVAIAIRNDHINFGQDVTAYEPSQLFMLESVISGDINDGVPDLLTQKWKNGVQVRDFHDVVNAAVEAGNQVGVVHLNMNALKQLDVSKAQEFWNRYQHAWFDFSNCFKAVMCCPFLRFMICKIWCCCIPDDAAMFCSEMATRLYQSLGFIPWFFDAENVSPQELAELTGDLDDVETDFFHRIVHIYQPNN